MASSTETLSGAVPDVRFMLPGFTLPLEWTPSSSGKESQGQPDGTELYPSALYDGDDEIVFALTTLREFAMMEFMNSVTDKPEWHTKVLDDTIANKWKEEAKNNSDFTQSMADWCIDELRWKAESFNQKGLVTALDPGVVKSDSAVSTELRKKLQAAVKPLEDVPPKMKDYHPGSDEKVVDLVHPSLFPLLYGRSRILRDKLVGLQESIGRCGDGEVIPNPSGDDPKPIVHGRRRIAHAPLFSKKFQWLPCDVEILPSEQDSSRLKCKIVSYINNLHPQRHKELYNIIAEVISAAIPLWNATLSAVINIEHSARRRIPYDAATYTEDAEEAEGHPVQGEDENEDDYWDRSMEWEREFRSRHVELPEPEQFKPRVEFDKFKGIEQIKWKNLQVIVKLANIELTPEKPEYDGGVWHVEGQLNEHICATALYYYSSENITESRLWFRQISDTEDAEQINYEQNDDVWLQPVFGCNQDGSALQTIGSVICKEGRLLTFANVLQHRVAPFKLEDPSKPGHRKILALFLVDPNIRIISTANVPPQQRDWWSEKLWAAGLLTGLSREMHDEVMNSVDDFPVGLDDAKKLREQLMDERKELETAQDSIFEHCATFSLCEH